MKGITILGSTGSIGLSTLDVLTRHQDKFRVVALTANSNVEALIKQCKQWQPEYAVMANTEHAEMLSKHLQKNAPDTTVLAGEEGLEKVSQLEEVDYVMAAIVGAAGLLPTLAAARAGKRVLLANKEALVMSGQLFIDAIRENNAELLPIDSEHNAIFQCLPHDVSAGLASSGVTRILLTASGGPFRTISLEELEHMTPDQACAHPNWSMGRKISVDSATMMNKGLEVIEACWLFNTSADQIQVVIHPQSVIHSLVQYADGSVLAQLGNPDMRTPIAHALAWPDRFDAGVEPLDLFKVAHLDFESPDYNRFPCLRLAKQAVSLGGTSTAILNAANEVAVESFLNNEIRFTDIARVVEHALENIDGHDPSTLDIILKDDADTRDISRQYIRRLAA